MWNNYLFLIVLIPIIVSIVNLIFPKLLKKIITLLGVAVSLIISIKIFMAGSLQFSMMGFTLFQSNSLSNFILLFVNILSFIILIYSLKNVKSNIENKFFLLFPLTVSFSNGVAISSNMVAFMIFWGLTGMLVYLFGVLSGAKGAESSRKSFIIIGTSDILLIVGLVIMYLSAKTSDMYAMNVELSSLLTVLAFICMILSAFTKAGAFPMHTWVPDFAKDAPIESVALLPAAMDKLLGIYLFARIMIDGLFIFPYFVNIIIMIIGVFTIITAVMMALIQHNGRRLLGYHAVSQVGYMVLGIGTGTAIGIIGGLFHMLNNAIYKSNLFLSFGSVEKKTGTADLDEMGGLARRMPMTFVAALIGALAISGVPPLNGFFSKWMVYQSVLEAAATQTQIWQIVMNICLVLAVFGSALTLASFIKFIHSIYLSKLPKKYKNITEVSFTNWFGNNLLALLCVIFGIFVYTIPVKLFLMPLLPEGTTIRNILLGFYEPGVILSLFVISIILGIIIYLVFKKIRFDDEYVGTMPTTEANRITGVDFYNDVKEMQPFKTIYGWAKNKYFDIYKYGTDVSLWFGDIFHKLHTGLLHTYAIWTLAGLVIVTLILISAL